MPKLNQRGITHIFLILFLLAGLAVGVYLVQQKTNIFPKAFETPTNSSCYARLGRFSVDKPCAEVQNGFRSASFDCLALAGSVLDPSNQTPAHNIGTPETCKLAEDWLNEANNICQSICQNPTPTPLLKPQAPTSVMQSCYQNGMGALLTWDSPAKEFVIRLQDLTSPNYPVKEINATEFSYNLTIIPNFTYRWNVYAVENGIRSDSSDYKTFTCKGKTE